ncbi:MAG: T9SS type A sorting domain-containing protein [Flavobacteriales bacterium]|nr:T9SS type A sorting domain-containing protein [Flavobacteriales bacterium]
MKQGLYTFGLVLLGMLSYGQGTIVEDTIVLHLDYNDIDSIIVLNGLPSGLLAINNDIEVHRVIYETPDVDGSTTTASGLVMVPVVDSCSFPMLAYLHGTKLKKSETFYYLKGEWQLGVIAGASGYAVVLPDYIGLGASPGIHPYQHTESQATASIDIMRVCRTICEQEQRQLNGQLFIMGYSQGGHATMGTHRMIQEELSGEFTVTASAPGAGAYDLSGTQLDMVASFDPYSVPGYLPYLIQSYQHVYGNLYDSIQEIFVPPYDQTLLPLLQGDHDMWEVDAAMPPVPRDIIQPAYADAFFSDTTHPAYLALKANDVYEWVPEAPVMFNYCRSDEQVSYVNTIVASEYMINAGAVDIQVVERDTAISHFECASPSLLFSKVWFDTMAEFCNSGVGIQEQSKSNEFKIYPNPNSTGLLQFENARPVFVSVSDLMGREFISAQKISVNGSLDISGLKPGVALIQIMDGENRTTKRLVVE